MDHHSRMESIADLLIAGGLSSEETREAERHAAACAECGALLRDARDFAAWAKGLIAPDAPPPGLEDRLVEGFRAAAGTRKRRFVVGKRVLKITGTIAAAVALVFLGNLFSDRPAAARQLSRTDSAEADFRGDDRHWAFLSRGGSVTRQSEMLGGKDGDESLVLRDSAPAERGLQQGVRAGSNADKASESYFGLEHRAMPANGKDDQYEGKLGKLRTIAAPASGGERTKTADVPALDAVTARLVAEPASPAEPERLARNPVQDNRKIIRSAEVSIEVDSYDATYTKVVELAGAEKGHVASANTQKLANGKIQATVVVRIPPERFEAVIARLKELGTVRHQNIGSEDVTKAYVDLESRLKSKEILAARLSKLLAEGKGTVKELMEVEVQLGGTNEAIEQIKGEIKYYDNRIGLSTLTLEIAEKDLGQPFEYVQTLQANLALTVRDPDDAYAKAQKEIVDAGGQVVDSRMNRQSDGSSTGTVRGRVDADKFQALRDALKKYGVATNDTVNQQKTARGGREGAPKADAPLRKEQAVLDVTLNSPPIFVTRRSQLLVETPEVESAYGNARQAVEGAGGKIVDGSLNGRSDRMAATLRIQIDADKFAALVESLKSAGKVKNAVVNSVLPAAAADGGAALLRERAEIEFSLVSPPQLIADENGLGKTIRDTFANSWAGLLWSIEKLFVGISLAGPWVLLLAAGILVWRRRRARKAPAP
ncbi:MAG: DUF4349 domain-containing protein [Planctomycetaceae bacterium]|nr:DUF4349 domain-containing protein [Planctomycetaceae bacterium]